MYVFSIVLVRMLYTYPDLYIRMIQVTVMRDDRHTVSSCYGSKLDFPRQPDTAMFGYGRIPRRGKRGEMSIIFRLEGTDQMSPGTAA